MTFNLHNKTTTQTWSLTYGSPPFNKRKWSEALSPHVAATWSGVVPSADLQNKMVLAGRDKQILDCFKKTTENNVSSTSKVH